MEREARLERYYVQVIKESHVSDHRERHSPENEIADLAVESKGKGTVQLPR